MGFGSGLQLRPVPAPRSAAEEAARPGQRRCFAGRAQAEPAQLAPGGAMVAGAAPRGLLALLLVVSAPLRLQAEEPGEWSECGGRRAGPGGIERGGKSGLQPAPRRVLPCPADGGSSIK